MADQAANEPSPLGVTRPGDEAGQLDRPGATSARPQPAVVARRLTRRLTEWVVVLALAAGIAFLLRAYVVETFYVPSGSMEPTLLVGDRILVDKLPFASTIHRGDIIVFRRVPRDTDPTRPADLVKRVIGLPGETISSRGDTIYIDGRPLREPWLPNLKAVPASWDCYQSAYDIPTTHIPPHSYFVMGDCRNNSLDSRAWGTVPASYIVGKVFLVIWRNSHPWFHWF